MQHLGDLERILMLGTDRIGQVQEVEDWLNKLNLADPQDAPPQQVLKALIISKQLQKGRGAIENFSEKKPAPVLANTGRTLNKAAIDDLHQVINGPYENALPAFIQATLEVEKSIPPYLLPELLDRCLTNQGLFETIKPLLGERGWWLINLNSAWQTLGVQSVDLDVWNTLPLETRLHWFEQLRAHDPIKAIQFLEQCWPTMPLFEQEKFLPLLQRQASAEDEPFLRPLQEDQRKSIRGAVSYLLAGIPGSEQQKRLFLHTVELLSDEHGHFEVQLPDKIVPWMETFGIISKRTGKKKWGAKSDWIYQLVANIHPRQWEKFFDKLPIQILSVWQKSTWGHVFLNGIVKALWKNPDQRWLEATGRFLLKSDYKEIWDKHHLKIFHQLLDEALFQKLIENFYVHHPQIISEKHPFFWLVSLGNHKWPDAFAMKWFITFLDFLSDMESEYLGIWHYKKLFEEASYRVNPFLHDQLKAEWTYRSRYVGSWERQVASFIETLKFRKEMLAHIQTD